MTKHVLDHEIELYREDDHYVVLVEMRGYDRDDLDVTWHDNRLHIEAHHVDENAGRTRVFQRSMSFPKQIDDDAISATVADGTLEVTLPIVEGIHDAGKTIDID